MAIHKKPMGGGLSAVGGNSEYTYYKPTDAKYKGLVEKLYDIPDLLPSMDLGGEPLPLLWTCDYIPKTLMTGDSARTTARAPTIRPSTSASSTARASASQVSGSVRRREDARRRARRGLL